MDSRIREIEQWIERAKTGLSDGGREEYVKKLFLLDAEIRAVIKESGTIPGAETSPVRRGSGARRSAFWPGLTGAVAGVLILVAAAAWFVNPVSLTSAGLRTSSETPSLDDSAAAGRHAAHIPGAISGEEVIVARWLDSKPFELLAAASGGESGPGEKGREIASEAPVLDIGPELRSRGGQPGQEASMQNAGQSVILAVGALGNAGSGVQLQPAAFGKGGQPVLDLPRPVAPPADRFVSVDIVDNSNPQDPDDVDKLDPDALKRNVEKHFAE
jgi:hypothetical protein